MLRAARSSHNANNFYDLPNEKHIAEYVSGMHARTHFAAIRLVSRTEGIQHYHHDTGKGNIEHDTARNEVEYSVKVI